MMGDWDAEIRFPQVEPSFNRDHQLREFCSLDDNTQKALLDIVGGGSFTKMDSYQREVYIQIHFKKSISILLFLFSPI